MKRSISLCMVIVLMVALAGTSAAATDDDVQYAPPPSLDPSLVPDADGFVFEEVAPGVHRLVTDGAGHFPSARYIREARDMDRLAVDEEGRVLVWSTTHGGDNDIAGDQQLWILGVEGVPSHSGAPLQPSVSGAGAVAPDGSTWSLVDSDWREDDPVRGVIRSDGDRAERFLADQEAGSLAITPDGRVWVAVGHGSGEAGGIYVIEPDAVGEPVDIGELPLVPVMGGPAPAWAEVLDLEDREVASMIAIESGLLASAAHHDEPTELWSSTDGTDWSRLDSAVLLGEGAVLSEIAEGGPGLMAVGSVPAGDHREAMVWTSADGQEWSVSPLGLTIPAPGRPFEVSELEIQAVAAGPAGAVVAARPYTGIDFSLLEPSVAAALPAGLRPFASGNGVMIDPSSVSASVGPFQVFSKSVHDLDLDQDLFDAYRRAVNGWSDDVLLFVTDDYVTWQQVDEWPGVDPLTAITVTNDGYMAATMGWGGAALYASADGITWEETELAAVPGWVFRYWADGDRLLAISDLGGRAAVWASDDGGETWTAWAGLPGDAWDLGTGAFGLVASGEYMTEWWDPSILAPTVLEHDGLTLRIGVGPRRSCAVLGPDGEALLTASCREVEDGLPRLALPSFIEADNERGVFTVADPRGGDPLMTVTYREMQDAFESAQGSEGPEPDAFVAYSADGRVWSQQRISDLTGTPGWVGPLAVGDDFAVIVIGDPDGRSSLWRATMD